MDSRLSQYVVFADALYEFWGDISEIVIHDLRKPNSSIVYIKGNLTQRKIGEATTNIIINELSKKPEERSRYLITDMKTKNGKILRSLSIFLSDEQGVYGCFCILIDPTYLNLVIKYFESFLNKNNTKVIEKEIVDKSDIDIPFVTERLIDEAISDSQVTVEFMQKEDKLKVVSRLQNKGIFLMKGSVERVASKLKISKYTVYNYLDEIKAEKTYGK
ncbi:helix-turn-helix transcriptional regulator [Peptococcus niger]|uniref:Predicted transcriptional regulator YheO, contains PAS and DNA-binding HTH domains n=1 Tax=Peptococcus niger TaxID=2741 RepID=A0A1G6YEE5_PEPNI|nr:PAS domain-containing protein [Peptococcus niger]SDD88748.1 Predicted transcriptional regulator YheO, contains PAS and DNA-binding HTH domains [Peptococcus niger]